MIAPSKLNFNTKTIGYFGSISYSCYECGHTWEPSCCLTTLQTFRDSMKFSLKVYSSFYLFSLLVKLRKQENFNLRTFMKLFRDILQSSVFLSLNGTLFICFFCITRYLVGKFYGWHGLAVATLVGYVVINIERKSRRGMLALYMANLACETLFNIAVSKNFVSVVPNGQIYMFIAASLGFMSLFRSFKLNENLRQSLRFIVGNDEEMISKEQPEKKGDKPRSNIISAWIQPIKYRLKALHRQHKMCSHPHSCAYYTLKGFARNFLLGYGLQSCLNVLSLLRGRLNFSNFVKSFTQLKTCSLGLFVGFYNALFRSCNCLLRWIFNKDFPALFGAISGAVAGVSAYFYKSTTISMYFLFKLIEVLGSKAMDKKWLPRIPYLPMHVYALSLGIVIHAACLEPHNIRPAYWKFLCGVSGNKFPLMFRKLFDLYGTKASSLYPDFIPNLDPKYVTSPDVQKLLKAAGKWK